MLTLTLTLTFGILVCTLCTVLYSKVNTTTSLYSEEFQCYAVFIAVNIRNIAFDAVSDVCCLGVLNTGACPRLYGTCRPLAHCHIVYLPHFESLTL